MKIIIASSFLSSLKRMNSFLIKRPFIYLKYGIINLIRWFPVIWNDRDWDFTYTYIVLLNKIKSQRKMFEHSLVEGCRYGINTPKHIKRLKECEEILNRLIDDNYILPEYLEQLRTLTFSSILDNNTRRDLIIKNQEYENYCRNRDKGKLYQILFKYGDGWWD